MKLERIVSGGQAGADRAALDFALAHKLPHGGWCPLGRWAEDGPIAACYQLHETPTAEPAERTEWNVRDSDATVILSISPTLSGGSQQTLEFAQFHHKPRLHLSSERDGRDAAAAKLRAFLEENAVRILNVAGPRESKEPAVGAFARRVLEEAIGAGLQHAR